MVALILDLRYGTRMLRKNPGFTAVAVITLALGIGANTAIFSVVNAVLLRSLPFPHPTELVDISARSSSFDVPFLGLSLPDIADLRAGASSFAALATYQDSPKEISGEGKPERIESTEVSEDFFPVLGLRPLHGRTFTSADMQPGSRAVVLSYSVWRDRFGGDPAAVGKTVTLDGQTCTIIGVMPAQPPLGFATDSKVWTAFIPTDEQRMSRDGYALSVVARLKPGISPAQAQKELDTIEAHLTSAYPDAHQGWSVHATSLKQYLLGDARTPLAILFSAVGFVLLIACANVSNLFLSRAWARRREFAIRSAIGATRGALLRQLAVETLLVALAGGACAFFIATWTVHGLRPILPPGLPRAQDLRINSNVAWFTLGASLLAALLSGLAPALLSTRQDVSMAIKESSAGAGMNASSAGHNFLRQLLVVGEVALAVILLLGATLAVRSFGHLLRLDLGFRPDHLLTMRLDFPKFRFTNTEQSIAFVRQVLDGTRAIPGVNSASAGLVFPMSDEFAETTFQTEATASDPKLGEQTALANRVAPDFFQTLRIPMLAGHDFSNADVKGNSLVFIVNETLASKYFGSVNVVGKRFSTRKESGHPIWGEIIGVTGNVREASLHEPKPQIYAPFYQTRVATGVYLMVRSTPDPMTIVSAIQDRIWSVDKNQPITAIMTVEERIAMVNAAPRSLSLLLGIFGALGFALALVGIYGVMSYLVSLRTCEIGIRMTLGADPAQILRLVIAHGLKLTLTGVFMGVASGLALTRFMRTLLFGISATDPSTFVSIAVLLTLVALAACFIPARRAITVDPMVALRYE
jgi:putative ABC transport system permease protein